MALVSLAGSTASLSAAEDPPYGTKEEDHLGRRLTACITGVDAPGMPASGTNCQIVVGAAISAIPSGFGPGGGGGGPVWGPESVEICNFRVWMNEEELAGFDFDLPTKPGVAAGVTYASTHFEDDEEITIKLQVQFWGYVEGQGSTTVTLTVEVKPKAYNKGLVLATPETSVAQVALASAQTAGEKLEAMNHSVKPQPLANAASLTQSQLGPLLTEATAFFAATHGSPEGIQDAGVPPNWMSWTWTGSQSVSAKAQPYVPPYNLVVLIACSTAAGNLTHRNTLMGAFGIPSTDGSDRAMVVFQGIVNKGMGYQSVPAWTERFYGALLEGTTVAEALKRARVLRAGEHGESFIAPLLLGDPEMTLYKTVYGGPFGQ